MSLFTQNIKEYTNNQLEQLSVSEKVKGQYTNINCTYILEKS